MSDKQLMKVMTEVGKHVRTQNADLAEEGFSLDPVKLDFKEGMRFRAFFKGEGGKIDQGQSEPDPETGECKDQFLRTWVFELMPQHGAGTFWVSGASQLDRKLLHLVDLYENSQGENQMLCVVDATRGPDTKLQGGKKANNYSINHRATRESDWPDSE